ALFTGQLTGNLKFGNVRDTADISGRGDFNYGLFDQTVSLTDATLRLSVERAMDRLQLPLPVKAKGRVIVDLDEYKS
ncbi:type II secretion system protein N, partial [Streptomyces galilaeus]|uniref:type II secretion system protein N n=1 Tax=Streptomyces galilaeus TaxID=33899 RepID=UPI0038F60BC0